MFNQKIITIKTKTGLTLTAFDGDSITKEIQSRGEYDGNTLQSIRDVLSLIKPQMSLDVGANIGNHAVVIATLTKKLIAFEPVTFVYDVLKSNLAQNKLGNAIAVNFGLSLEQSTKKIFIPMNGNLGSSSLEAVDGEGAFLKIDTVSGDAYLAEHSQTEQIDFIKMDVEGHEAAALIGLQNTIQKYQPLLLLEWKSANTTMSFKDLDLFNRLFSGYKFYSLSYTSNKKVHPRNWIGFCKRICNKLTGNTWCLSSFDSDKSYSNVYFVPERYQNIFLRFNYLEQK
ncbi:MAG TPA: FkbM family methyltransferase [Methylotenera sp.]|nr:FkbM family methyltransferase [Methylotenera sp.]